MSQEKMQVQDILSPHDILADLRAGSKGAALRDLSRRAGEALGIAPDTISAALLKREQLGSTGMGNGFAIPHASVAGIKRPFGMLARLGDPIDFDAIDGQGVDLIFLLLLPEPSQGQQLNALACVARRLRAPEVLAALREAKDARAMYQSIVEPVV